MTNARARAALIALAAILAGCQTIGSADCDFWTEPPISDNDADVISSPLARWLDSTISSADRICK